MTFTLSWHVKNLIMIPSILSILLLSLYFEQVSHRFLAEPAPVNSVRPFIVPSIFVFIIDGIHRRPWINLNFATHPDPSIVPDRWRCAQKNNPLDQFPEVTLVGCGTFWFPLRKFASSAVSFRLISRLLSLGNKSWFIFEKVKLFDLLHFQFSTTYFLICIKFILLTCAVL